MIKYSELKWTEVTLTLKRRWLLLPVGGLEQHGPHLPLNVDTVIVERLVESVAKKLDCVVAPTITYGARSLPCSGGGAEFPGTIRIRGSVLIQYYYDIISEFVKNGAAKLLILNGHWENEPFLLEALELCREKVFFNKAQILFTSWWSLVPNEVLKRIFPSEFTGWHAEHASQTETALMMYLSEHLVGAQLEDNEGMVPAGLYSYPLLPEQKSAKGVLGKASMANPEMGEQLFEHVYLAIINLLAKSDAAV